MNNDKLSVLGQKIWDKTNRFNQLQLVATFNLTLSNNK